MLSEKEFKTEVEKNIERLKTSQEVKELSLQWLIMTGQYSYAYNFMWMGLPIIQVPQDIVAVQELVWKTKPQLIIETGVARGGSLILSASLLALLDLCEQKEVSLSDREGNARRVIGIDIQIHAHNRKAIEQHPLSPYIALVEGSSTDTKVIEQVREIAKGYDSVMVCLDSNHTHAHVLEELKVYAELVTIGNYCIVFDTAIEDVPAETIKDRPWGKGNNPKTAVWEFIRTHPEFQIDHDVESKILISSSPDGYLRRTDKLA